MIKYPTEKTEDFRQFFTGYLTTLSAAADTVDFQELDKAVQLISQVIRSGGTLYSLGNGGSAAIANHLQCDFSKGIATKTRLLPKVVSLSAEVCTLTAIANDISYQETFAFQLDRYLKEGDLVLAISSSGNSPNIIRGLEIAKTKPGVKTILFCGFEGGQGSQIADSVVHFRVRNYGIAEDLHHMTMHMIAQFLRLCHLEDSGVSNITF